MEDSFNVRVGKVFGSLNSSSSSSSASSSSAAQSLTSLWSLTDAEIEKREWNRDESSPEPETRSSSLRVDSASNAKLDYRDELEDELQELDDEDEGEDEDEEKTKKAVKPDDYNDEEWELKSSIGMDVTLDYEEEEDEYDKVAVSSEKPEDRLYMRAVEDYGIDIDGGDELPVSFRTAMKDPRANLSAAKIRLEEDDEAAKNIHSLRFSDENPATTTVSGDGASNPKSILKRKDNQSDSKTQKRVRFDPECYTDETDNDVNEARVKPSSGFPVPDYLQNPCRYTRYTFDSCNEMSEDSNKQAFMEFRSALREEKRDDSSSDGSPRSITFIPRKKKADSTTAMVDSCTELVQQVGIGKDTVAPRRVPTGIVLAAADSVCAMEEDESNDVSSKNGASQNVGRHYRTKPRSESND